MQKRIEDAEKAIARKQRIENHRLFLDVLEQAEFGNKHFKEAYKLMQEDNVEVIAEYYRFAKKKIKFKEIRRENIRWSVEAIRALFTLRRTIPIEECLTYLLEEMKDGRIVIDRNSLYSFLEGFNDYQEKYINAKKLTR